MSSYEEMRNKLQKKYISSSSNTTGSTQAKGNTNSSYEEIRNNLQDKYSADNTQKRRSEVSSWIERYKTTLEGLSKYSERVNGRYTKDVGGGYGKEIEALIRDYDSIKDYADRNGLPNARRYVNELKKLQSTIRSGNEYMSQLENAEAYNKWKEDTEEINSPPI